MPYPKRLYRDSDGECFSLNNDGKTYSIEWFKVHFPRNLHCTWTYDTLMDTEHFWENPPSQDLMREANMSTIELLQAKVKRLEDRMNRIDPNQDEA